MKLFYELDNSEICIVMTLKEARQFDAALQNALADKKSWKPLRKSTAAYKLAQKISDLMPIW